MKMKVMEKENIHIDWEVISKSFRGELSGEERERLESWLAVSSRHRDFYCRALEGGETDATSGRSRRVGGKEKRVDAAGLRDDGERETPVVVEVRVVCCGGYFARGDCCRDVGEHGRTGEKYGDCSAGATG